ncbi:MAG: hypothetical protein G01um10148_754 [Parcubacteria group bacterium Gr01-1014_8]|nr:MAG: hypothetical protein G01um10148_754 [Parcubacteria group bacterium Gr01-1014_8]
MSEPKKPAALIQSQSGRLNWERIESDENVRAVLIQTFSLGGNTDDAVNFLSKIGCTVPVEKLKGRLDVVGGKPKYITALRATPPSPDVMERRRNEVQTHLLLLDHVRSRVWCFVTNTRAAAVYMLKKGEIAGDIARVVSRQLQMTPEIDEITIIHLTKRAGGPDAFAARLQQGNPPFTEPLSDAELAQGKKDVEYYLPIARSRMRERAEWMKTDETRAFVLALVADRNVSVFMIEWALKKKFGMELGYSGLWDRIQNEKGDILEEKRANFVEARKVGLDDEELNEQMRGLAAEAQNEYFGYLQNMHRRKGELANISINRKKDIDARSSFEPLQALAEAIRIRSTQLGATEPPASVTLRYTNTPGDKRAVPTLFVGVNETDPDVSRLLHSYVRKELLEMQAGYEGILQRALTSNKGEPFGRAMLRGPNQNDFEVFSFSSNGQNGR